MGTNPKVEEIKKYLSYIFTDDKLRNIEKALSSDGYRDSPAVIKLFNNIAELCARSDNRFVTPLSRGTIVYRARAVENIGYPEVQTQGIAIDNYNTKGYNEINSREAPLGQSPAGRNNISGVSYFYGASEPATACAELKAPLGTIISVAEFEIIRDISLFDFEKVKNFDSSEIEQTGMALGRYWGEIMFWFQRPVITSEDYRITQIIADEIRKQGFGGLCYNSFYGDGRNYTLFHCGSNILTFKNSRLVHLMFSNQIFRDFNNNVNLESYSDPQTFDCCEQDDRKGLDSIQESWKAIRKRKVGNKNE